MTTRLDAKACLGVCDVLFVTLDTLRYDVAQAAYLAGETPILAALLPPEGWERRHSPSSFTYGAHHAFFAGFLPTPVAPRGARAAEHERLFAAHFPGSETTGPDTLVFEEATIVEGFAAAGYHTLCVGGVGFFNKRSALGRVLPALFAESAWEEEFGVSAARSTEAQVAFACARLAALPAERRLFLFLNVSACHPPTAFYQEGATADTADTQRAALAYADQALAPLFAALTARAPVLSVICSDHGAAFGEDGYRGHRIGHPTVWETPYLQTVLPQREETN